MTQRVLSGVQPTGALHLGNYLGAIRNFAQLQNTHECLYCVVDLHAITFWQNPDELRQATYEVAAAFIAAGVDPEAHIVFNQSQVPEHTELTWMLSCVARIGWLNRMTQFKDKAGKNREQMSVGLYTYPVLMAADILAYKATHVPVGEDQKQHLELARDIAQKFNNDTGAEGFFPLPEPLIQKEAARIMSLRDGTKKMSKSEPSEMSRIGMMDDADTIAKKIRKAKTDPEPLPETKEGLAGRAEAENLVGIYAALAACSVDDVLAQFAGKGFGDFKPAMAELAIEKLAPISDEMNRLLSDKAELDRLLASGAERARAIASPVVREARQLLGFVGA